MFYLTSLGLILIPTLAVVAIYWSYTRLLKSKQAQIRGLAEAAGLKEYFAWAYGGDTVDVVLRRSFDTPQFILPIGLCLLSSSTFLGAFLLSNLPSSFAPRLPFALLLPLPDAAIAGFAGAFVWGHYEILRRLALVDLSPLAFYLLWLRLLVGSLSAWFITQAFAAGLQLPLAFAIGAFPLRPLRDYFIAFAQKHLQSPAALVPSEAPTLHAVQGMTGDTIERLAEEGITSTQHLALANPIRLFLRTNLELPVILDLIDQAILHLFVGDRLPALRAAGMRSAIEVAEITDFVDSQDPADKQRGAALVASLATALGVDEPTAIKLIESIYYDPQVSFIWEVWGEAFGA